MTEFPVWPGTWLRTVILLPLRVSNDFGSGNMFNSLLRIVHKYPLREEDYKSDELSPLYQQVITAAKKHLEPYSPVSVRFYTIRISQTIPIWSSSSHSRLQPHLRNPRFPPQFQIQIFNCRYAAQGMANMKKQRRSSHRRQPVSMSMNLFEFCLSSSRVALDKLISMS